MFTGNTKVLDEKEKGDERLFFKRIEGKKLRLRYKKKHQFFNSSFS